jgi:hypothetical protein
MRDYSKVSPKFWTGSTGRQIRKLGHQAQVISFYAFTCPSANMIGLYYLSLPTLCHETGSPLEGALKALRSLSEAGFCHYSEEHEQLFVPNMAREQIGETLTKKDNRHKAVVRELEQYRKSPFFNQFLRIYKDCFELEAVEFEPEPPSPLEGPSEPLQRGGESPLRSQEQEQEQEQKQEQEQDSEQTHVEFGNSTAVESEPPEPQSKIPIEVVQRVFDHWRTTHSHPRAILDDGRKRLIRRALSRYSEADLCQSITGFLSSPHHMGENDRNTVYDDIEVMLRNSKQVEMGLRFHSQPQQPQLSALGKKNVAATHDWLPPELRNAAK